MGQTCRRTYRPWAVLGVEPPNGFALSINTVGRTLGERCSCGHFEL